MGSTAYATWDRFKIADLLTLFCDGSVNPQSKIGFGAYFIVQNIDTAFEKIEPTIQTKLFNNTSSTKLELEVLLWALSQESLHAKKLVIYTDCQNIIHLTNRRAKLQKNGFRTSKGKLIANHELYKAFYTMTDRTACEFIKIEGHKATKRKGHLDRLFNLVDKASRSALRAYLNNREQHFDA